MTVRRNSPEAGLTLVELLVVLAILTVLSGLLLTGLHSVADVWPRIARSNADHEEREATRRMLRHILSHIYPAKRDDGSGPVVRFEGERNRMDFLAPLAQRFGTDDVVHYSLGFADDGLSIAWHLDRETAEETNDPIPPTVKEIIPDFRDVAFSFYGPAEAGEETRWWNRWNQRKALPLLLRVRFLWRGRSEELIVAPRITAGACSTSTPNAACQE
jgi:prepilin-type N-terminal cleavage/methylation domain-containing protein